MKVAVVESTALWCEAIRAVLREADASVVVIESLDQDWASDKSIVQVVRVSNHSATPSQRSTDALLSLELAPTRDALVWLTGELASRKGPSVPRSGAALRLKHPWRAPSVKVMPATNRELAVLRRIAEGRTTAEIAIEIGVSNSTVSTHRRKLYKKWAVHTAGQAVAIARSAGLLENEDRGPDGIPKGR